MALKFNPITGQLDLVNSAPTNYWTTDTSQTSLTGDKSGSFDLETTGIGTFTTLDLGEVYILHSDGTQTRYTASADTDTARGTALATAIAASVDGDTIFVPGNDYFFTTAAKNIPTGVSLIGQSRTNTKIYGNFADALINLNSNSTVRNITFLNNNATGRCVSARIGTGGLGSGSNLLVYDCEFTSGFDSIWIWGAYTITFDRCYWNNFTFDGGAILLCNITIKNCYIVATPDGQAIPNSFLYTHTVTLTLENNHINITGVGLGVTILKLNGLSTVNSDGNYYKVTGTGIDGYIFKEDADANFTGTLISSNDHCIRSDDGSGYDINSNNGIFNISGGNILTTNGTATYNYSQQSNIKTGAITDTGLTASLGVYTDANKLLTSTPPTSGVLGHWSRTGTTLTQANANDHLGLGSGNITTSGDITISDFTLGSILYADTGGIISEKNAGLFYRPGTASVPNSVVIGASNTISGSPMLTLSPTATKNWPHLKLAPLTQNNISTILAGRAVGAGALYTAPEYTGAANIAPYGLYFYNGISFEKMNYFSGQSSGSITSPAFYSQSPSLGIGYSPTSISASSGETVPQFFSVKNTVQGAGSVAINQGTVTVNAGVTTVTGSATKFLTAFEVGDTITISGETKTINTITSDTVMDTTVAWVGSFSASTYMGSLNLVGTGTAFTTFLTAGDIVKISGEPFAITTITSVTSNTEARVTSALNTTGRTLVPYGKNNQTYPDAFVVDTNEVARARVGINTSAPTVELDVRGSQFLEGLITTYNNIVTEDYGVPAIVDGVHLASQTADIASTNITNAGTAGNYRVSYYLQDTTADVLAGILTLTFSWTDDVGATTKTDTVNLAATGRTSGVFYVRLASGNLTYATTHTGIFGSSAYRLDINAERVN